MTNYYMDDDSFNQFLKNIGGLENGYYSDRPVIKERYFASVNNGWLGLIKELIEKLIDLGWDRNICQIKEKFGGLRFYISSGSDEIYKVIKIFEELSYKVCENCGKPGKPRDDIGWLLTLCDKHYIEIKNK